MAFPEDENLEQLPLDLEESLAPAAPEDEQVYPDMKGWGPVPTDDDELTMPIDEENMVTPETLEQIAAEDPDLLTPEEIEEMDAEAPPVSDGSDHYANLAKDIDANQLNKIAQDLIDRVKDDEESRKDWYDRVKKGIRNLGVSEKTVGGASFKGASTVVHPILMESCTQFQSRAIQEMWPSAGPVQTQVLGSQTPEKQDQAERIQDYMNYLYTVEMTEAFTEEDNMLLRLPISGSTFKKLFYDPLKKRLSSVFVEPADFIVSYATSDLRTSPRFTHRIREYKNDVMKKEKTGFYVETDMGNVHNEDVEKPMLVDEIDKTEGKTRVVYDEDDDRATIYEVYVDYNVEEHGNDNALLKPYIITVDRDQQRVKRIQRNWKPDDPLENKRIYFTHYKFTPGLGYYGYGFLHLIGDMAATATGSLRALLDSAAFSNMQGGFRTRHSRIKGDTDPLAPGEWRETDSTHEELKDAFFAIPYKEPSATLFNLLGYVDEKARHLAGITETNTGEANPKNAPVGTTAMLLEQGSKVFTAIHKRIHEAHKQEFKIMAELVEEYMPDDGYPYLLGESEGTLMPSDFDERIDVIPVSDPNISSNAQRVAKAQSILELQQAYPMVIGEREAVKRMLEAIQVPNIDLLIGDDEQQAQKDADDAAKQAEVEALEKQRMQNESDKLVAELELSRSQTVKNNLEAIKLAFEAAALAVTSTTLVPSADALMGSAGFVDSDMQGLMPPVAEELPQLDEFGNPIDPNQGADPGMMDGLPPMDPNVGAGLEPVPGPMPPEMAMEPEPMPIEDEMSPDGFPPNEEGLV